MAQNKLFPKDPAYEYSDILPLAKRKGSPKGFGGVTLAVPNMLRDAAEGVNTLLRTPGQALRGELSPEEIKARAPGMALTLAGMGSPIPSPAGALRVFGGPLAKTADHGALEEAKRLWWNGTKDEEIFGKTGWFKDKDSKWKFEIPDSGATWHPGAQNVFPGLNSQKTLGDVLHHPDLFAAYPHLKDVKVATPAELGVPQAVGVWDNHNNMLAVGKRPPVDRLSVATHEINHAIQDHEGFAQGASPEMYLPEGFDEVHQATRDQFNQVTKIISGLDADPMMVREAMRAKAAGMKLPPSFQAELDKVPSDLQDVFRQTHGALSELSGMKAEALSRYNNTAGEISSRNVQERFENPQNYLLHPFQTPGYPSGDQIMIFGNQTPLGDK